MNSKAASGKRLQRQIIQTALRNINIKPLLHQTKFSGKHYNYRDIVKNLDLMPDNKYSVKAAKKGYAYRHKAFCQLPEGKVSILLSPVASYKPWCLIQTSDSTPELFHALNQALPGLKIMSVEYTIDFFCRDPDAVADIFYLLRRYSYFPNAKWTIMDGGIHDGWREPRKINAVYSILFDSSKQVKRLQPKSGKYTKIYERGEDITRELLPKEERERLTKGKRKKPAKEEWGWRHKNTNRVRLEFAIHRKNRAFHKMDLNTLHDLLVSPKFREMCFPEKGYDLIQFKNFKSKELPRDWEDYNSEDEEGNIESFQEEYLQAKKRGISNISQYTEHTPGLEGLKQQIKEQLIEFDREWVKRSAKLRKK